MSEWQPIETAPKTANDILVFGRWGFGPEVEETADRFHAVVYWSKGHGGWLISGAEQNPDSEEFNDLPVKPTHWMPLPPPPNGEKQGGLAMYGHLDKSEIEKLLDAVCVAKYIAPRGSKSAWNDLIKRLQIWLDQAKAA